MVALIRLIQSNRYIARHASLVGELDIYVQEDSFTHAEVKIPTRGRTYNIVSTIVTANLSQYHHDSLQKKPQPVNLTGVGRWFTERVSVARLF